MRTLEEIGHAVAERRRSLGLKQGVVARHAGLTQETLSRFENGRVAEVGSRKVLAVLAVLGMEVDLVVSEQSGTLDELRRERGK